MSTGPEIGWWEFAKYVKSGCCVAHMRVKVKKINFPRKHNRR